MTKVVYPAVTVVPLLVTIAAGLEAAAAEVEFHSDARELENRDRMMGTIINPQV